MFVREDRSTGLSGLLWTVTDDDDNIYKLFTTDQKINKK